MAIGWHLHPIDAEPIAMARARDISAAHASRLATTLGLFAVPFRARILYALDLFEELCVGEIALALDATEDAIGCAWRRLRAAGLVATRPQGRVLFFRLADDFPVPLRDHGLR